MRQRLAVGVVVVLVEVAASVVVPKLAPYKGDSKVKIVRRFTPDELAVINEYVRLMVLFKKTGDIRYVAQAVKIYDENNMLKIPGLTHDYLKSEIVLKNKYKAGGIVK